MALLIIVFLLIIIAANQQGHDASSVIKGVAKLVMGAVYILISFIVNLICSAADSLQGVHVDGLFDSADDMNKKKSAPKSEENKEE